MENHIVSDVLLIYTWGRIRSADFGLSDKSGRDTLRSLVYGQWNWDWVAGSLVEGARAGNGWLQGWLKRPK